MSRLAIEDPASATAHLASGGRRQSALAKSMGRWIARIRKERRIRRGIEEMMALDDRMLRDIGVSRSDVEYVARYGRWPWRMDDDVR
jgi:uncharacterized protein YjiS (DUF1127 family)